MVEFLKEAQYLDEIKLMGMIQNGFSRLSDRGSVFVTYRPANI